MICLERLIILKNNRTKLNLIKTAHFDTFGYVLDTYNNNMANKIKLKCISNGHLA